MVGKFYAVNADGSRFQSLHFGIRHRIHCIGLDVGTLYIPEAGKVYRRPENLHHTDTEGPKTVQNCIRADAGAAVVYFVGCKILQFHHSCVPECHNCAEPHLLLD